jgi:hypothetical protein
METSYQRIIIIYQGLPFVSTSHSNFTHTIYYYALVLVKLIMFSLTQVRGDIIFYDYFRFL